MRILLRNSVLLLPFLVFIDVKIPLGGLNVGVKDMVVFVLAFFMLFSVSKRTLLNNFYVHIWSLITFSTLFCNILTNSPRNYQIEMLRLFEGLIILLAIVEYLKWNDVEKLFKVFIYSGLVLALQFVLNRFHVIELDLTLGGIKGIWLAITILILYFNFNVFDEPKYLKILVIIFLFVSLFITEKRTWIFILGFIIMLDIAKNLSVKKVMFLSIIFLPFLFLVDLFFEKIGDVDRFTRLLPAILSLDYAEFLGARYYRWNTAFIQISNNWFLGVGFNNIDLQLPAWIITDNPDNQYLEIWLQNGFLSLLFFILLLYKGIKFKLSNDRQNIQVKIINNTFVLLAFGALTWAYMNGFGIILVSLMVGVVAHFYENKNRQIII